MMKLKKSYLLYQSFQKTKSDIKKFLNNTQKQDIAYIGHCHNQGYCTHAMAFTPEGAKKALKLVNWCDNIPIDDKYKEQCDKKNLLCKYAPTSKNYSKNASNPTWAGGIIKQDGESSAKKVSYASWI